MTRNITANYFHLVAWNIGLPSSGHSSQKVRVHPGLNKTAWTKSAHCAAKLILSSSDIGA